ncbi:MAG TPA: substrate-binding domain-containing protein [Steroidobacteraceae bacterium]|nr:substrate-binding domain-containing protein [Steroidobacteraceae bacterium]
MKPAGRVSSRLACGAALAACGFALAPLAAGAQQSAPATVEWQLPVAPTHPVQTKAQDLEGMRVGRPLPAPELLQPTLDAKLAAFSPRYGRDLGGTLRLMCSDVLPGLVRAWMASFSRIYPKAHFVLGAPFEGDDAANALRQGRVDIAFVSRELRPVDVASFRTKYGYDPTSIPVSGGSYRQFGFLDAVAIIVNPANPVKQLSLEQLDAAFSRSHLRGDRPAVTWGQLGARGTWAQRPVHVYAIEPWNGFEEFVRQRVLDAGGRRGHWRSAIHFDRTVFPIARRVAADPDGIGYTGLAFIDSAVKVIAVGRGTDAVSPTYTNVALARYPLSRLVYGNVNRRPGAALPPLVQEFFRFILSREGQQDVRREGIYLPLREFQVRAADRIGGLAPSGAK